MNYLPAVLVTVGVAVLSLTESTHMPSVSLNDKVVHGLMYTLLAVLWMIPVRRPIFVGLAVTIYVLADMIGVIIGVGVIWLIRRYSSTR